MVVHVLDNYYLAITFLISLALQSSLFLISFFAQTDKLTDLGGSANFFILALFTLLSGNTFYARNVVASVFVLIWSFRLGGFLFFRVLKTGKDGRFDEMRPYFFKFMGFWVFQLFWCWIVSLPVTILNSPNVADPSAGGGNVQFGTAKDIVGVILFAIGFLFEAISDIQKYLYKSNKPPKTSINDNGLWYFTRHPNFFGEILLWWGIYILALSPASAHVVSSRARRALYASVVGPIFISLLLFFVSGLPLAEKPTAKRYYLLSHGSNAVESGANPWGAYKTYLNKTSILFPILPALYAPLPTWLKQSVLLDFPLFKFDEAVDGPKALEEQSRTD